MPPVTSVVAPRLEAGRHRHSWPERVADGCDAVLDGSVVVLATWTLVYHVSLLTGAPATTAAAAEVALLAGWLVLRSARPRTADPDPLPGPEPVDPWRPRSPRPDPLQLLALASGGAAALAFALDLPWWPTAALWLLSALSATGWAVVRLRKPGAGPRSADLSPVAPDPAATGGTGPAGTASGTLAALGWAAFFAVLSLVVMRGNPDDLFYLNLSQWVVEHGTFPLRDTLFADQVFPMTSWPPMASYDALVGTVARLVGAHAASIAYLVVLPVATFLSVLALWRLLRAWRVPRIGVALSVGLVFMLFDADEGYASPGDLFATRLWQGKVILLCLLLPLLLVHYLRYTERPTVRQAGTLACCGVAAVGLSTTAMFLVPILAFAGVTPLALSRSAPRGWRLSRAGAGFAAGAGYPLLCGAVTVALHGRSADDFGDRLLYRFDPSWFGHEIFLTGVVALVGVTAVLAGAVLVPHPAARVTTAVLVLATGVTFVPGVTHLGYDVIGLGPTLWRVSWGCTVAALVGVLAAAVAERGRPPWLARVGPWVMAAALAVTGVPLWAAEAHASLQAPFHWQRSDESMAGARLAVAGLPDGAVVLAPQELAVTIAVLTTHVKTVAPRDYFLDPLRHEPGFHFRARRVLVAFANQPASDQPPRAEVAPALDLLDVSRVCLPTGTRGRRGFLIKVGYGHRTTAGGYYCVSR